ncbi:MAG TPA: hypothetical protein VMU03_12850 [Gammaproteobacteria bacterium]|nr:hypothetical protein [Gammaproteobacteria bacterium]
MTNDRPPDDKAQHEDAAKPGAAPRRGDKRDLEIERLERALADEKANAVSLREGSDALRFQLEILEKSYAKQLADARQRVDKPTKELAELKAQMAPFGLGGEDVAKILSELRADLLNVRAERNHLREQLGRPDANRGRSYGGRSNEQKSGDDSSDTINAMILDAGLQPKGERDDPGDGILKARVKLEQGPAEIMLSPDLIFTDKDKSKDDDKNAA